MASLTVGGVNIKVAVSSPRWTRSDAVDRARAFDNTFRASQTGGAVRVWDFETPPVLAATEGETYKAALSTIASQLCSGDIIALPTMCSAELASGTPVRVGGATYVTLQFSLHEIQPAKTLLRYAPGDTITGESFTRSTTATYYTSAGLVASAAINAKRDAHYLGGVRSLLLEQFRTNNFTFSEALDNAAWTKSDSTITTDGTTSPDGATTADQIVETATTANHIITRATTTTANNAQAYSFFAASVTRTWVVIITNIRDGTFRASWVNIATGAVGTKDAGHTIRTTSLAGGWWRIEVTENIGAGASATALNIGPASADGVASYLGDITKGAYVWGVQHEQDCASVSSYIPTAGSTVTRGNDLYSLPFTTPPQEMSVYAKFVELGTILSSGARVAGISSAADASPRFLVYNSATTYTTLHGNGTASVFSILAAASAVSNTVELNGRLFGDGSVDTTQSIGGAEVTVAVVATPLTPSAAWSGLQAWLGSAGTVGSNGFIALQSFKIVAGARSLDEMRAL